MMEQTVGEIAAENPSAVRVFEKYRIDYCCGGKRPLAEVCQERGLSADAVLAEVASSNGGAAPQQEWANAPLSELIRHIVARHHAYVKAQLPWLEEKLAKVIEKHGPAQPDVLPPLEPVFAGLAEELESHLRKEEMILFPAIEELEAARAEGREAMLPAFGTVQNPIRMMIFEHDNAGGALAEMRRLTKDYSLPDTACPTYRALFHAFQEFEADLHQHVHLENNILFPRAIALE